MPPDTLITLQRGACEDGCAVYRLIIFADGAIIYEGRYSVKKVGLAKGSLSPEVLARLTSELDAGGFFEFAGNYGFGDTKACKSISSGQPSAILSVSTGGRSKTILHEHGCTGAESDRLTALEDKVDQAAGTKRWIK